MNDESEISNSQFDSKRSEYALGSPPTKGVPGHVYLINVGVNSGLDGLFVPRRVAQQLLDDQANRKSQQDVTRSRHDRNTTEGVPGSYGTKAPAATADAGSLPGTLSRLLTESDEDPVPEHHHRVWKPSKMRERLARYDVRTTSDRELRSRDESVLRQILRLGPNRPLLQLSAVESALQRLEADFPNFRPIVQLVAGGLASGQRIPPILLVGPPGIGKTYFCNRLAEALTVPFELVSVASGANSSFLCGVGRNWANSEVGAVARLLALKPNAYANSMLLVDEIDKEPRERNNYPVSMALLELLEQESARRFRDLSIELALDASMLTWIATANRVDTIPLPLLSRLHLFVPRPPDAGQMLATAARIAAEVELMFDLEPIPRQAVAELADRTPREVRQALQAAAGRTKHAGRRTMTIADITELSGRGGEYASKRALH